MQHKRNFVKTLVLMLVAAVVICAGVLITRDVPPSRHMVVKQLDAKAILGQK